MQAKAAIMEGQEGEQGQERMHQALGKCGSRKARELEA